MTAQQFADSIALKFSFDTVGKVVVDGKTPFKYLVTIDYEGKSFTTSYQKGSAHVSRHGKPISYSELQSRLRNREMFSVKPTPPNINEVLECLKMDSQSVVDTPLWEDFASNFGYNEDSRKDHAVYEACKDIHLSLRKLFGKHFQTFLNISEE